MPSSKSLFKDQSVLSPHYVPQTLPFREAQIKEILSFLSPALKAQKPRNLFIYGKTGTGKTCVAKRVIEAFNTNGQKIKMFYINCRIYNSRYRVMQRALKDFVPELEKSGFGLTFLYEKLVDILNEGNQIMLVLDEIDMTKDLDDLVYTLTRINDEVKAGGLTIIGISNKLSFKDALDPRSKSSLYESEKVFSPYTSEQLQQILIQRAELAFSQGAAIKPAINLIAALTAQENGDARYALKLLHKAAEVAEHRESDTIDECDVETAAKNVDADLITEIANTLPQNHQIVLYSIATLSLNGSKYARLEESIETGHLFSGEVYDEYEHTAKQLRKKARSVRWYHEYLNDLEMLGLITTMPSSKGIRGKTTLIKLGRDATDIVGILKKILFGSDT